MKNKFISTIIILFILNACSSDKTTSAFVIDTVDIEDVDSIQIIRPGRNDDPDTVRLLTTSGVKDFLDNWNSCSKNGPRKYLPRYVLIVYRDKKEPKHFRTTRDNIKDENTDWCATFPDSLYFDNLWTSKSASH
jgi:hypothetical protein